VPARSSRRAVDCRVVKRRDQRVGMPETQCRVRGMARTNSGIAASKRVPSDATIW
jgi:hypothetical protein